MWIGIISIFPEMFQAITNFGITSRAVKKSLLSIKIWNLRNFARNRHGTVDNCPYGGGSGMIMMVQPLRDAINAAKTTAVDATVVYLSPQGRRLDHQGVHELVKRKKLILVCGRYEGIDDRIIKTEIDEEWSVGDYVLSGGELPAMILIDTITRFIPGAIGGPSGSVEEDSFVNGLLEYPHFTRPRIFEGKEVPRVLLSGNHYEIQRWRLKQSLGITWLKRPDLLENLTLNDYQVSLLTEFQQEFSVNMENNK
ncbi:MAG: tRNA (guanosine(37)-N1)-methyltransferase TrmD [Candidatus Dasytiphilus stammeri]